MSDTHQDVLANISPVVGARAARRVGYVLKMYPRLAETFILNEILGLEDAGVKVTVFSLRVPAEGRFQREVPEVRADVHYLPGTNSNSVIDAFRALGGQEHGRLQAALDFVEQLPDGRRGDVLVQALHLAAAIREGQIDHLHAHFMTVAAHTVYVAHLLSGVPFTVTVHAKDLYRVEVNRTIFGEIAAAAEALVTVCEANRDFIMHEFLNDSNIPVRVVYNGLPLADFSSDQPERDPRLVLAVGRLVEKKGFDILLRACRLLEDRGLGFRCLIVGNGEEYEPLTLLIEELGIGHRVQLVGAQSRDRILQLMARSRVLAAPCVVGLDGNQDALPTVILEAMAMGLPVVSTPIAGIPEMIADGVEGYIVGEANPHGLANALQQLLVDDRGARRMGAAGRTKVAAKFDRSATLPALVELFNVGRIRVLSDASR